MDFTEIVYEGMDWIVLVQDRIHKKVLGNMVIKLKVS
jgi:hypothetical protein